MRRLMIYKFEGVWLWEILAAKKGRYIWDP
jgi:hypothetical protein